MSDTIEYTLIDQVNDRPQHAHELAELLKDIPVKINLIPFNPFDLVDYKRVSNNDWSPETIEKDSAIVRRTHLEICLKKLTLRLFRSIRTVILRST